MDGEKQGSPVVAGGRARFFADDEEAGGIGRAVLDGLFEQGQAVHLRGERSAESGSALRGLVAGDLRGFGGG